MKTYLILAVIAMALSACNRDKGASGAAQIFNLGTPACNGGDVCRGDR